VPLSYRWLLESCKTQITNYWSNPRWINYSRG